MGLQRPELRYLWTFAFGIESRCSYVCLVYSFTEYRACGVAVRVYERGPEKSFEEKFTAFGMDA